MEFVGPPPQSGMPVIVAAVLVSPRSVERGLITSPKVTATSRRGHQTRYVDHGQPLIGRTMDSLSSYRC